MEKVLNENTIRQTIRQAIKEGKNPVEVLQAANEVVNKEILWDIWEVRTDTLNTSYQLY